MKVLIVEDELKTTDYLKKGLIEQGCVVDLAHDGLDGQHLALAYDYDVIVLDAMLPGRDGFAVMRDAAPGEADAGDHADRARPHRRPGARPAGRRRRLPGQAVLVPRAAGAPACAAAARPQPGAGAAEGRQPAGRPDRAQGLARPTRIDLTAKEFALLAVLARRQGEILSKTAIAELVWDMNFDSNTNVVEVAIKRLRAKIDGPFAPQPPAHHPRHGLRPRAARRRRDGAMRHSITVRLVAMFALAALATFALIGAALYAVLRARADAPSGRRARAPTCRTCSTRSSASARPIAGLACRRRWTR